MLLTGKELGVDGVVLWPAGFDGTCEGEDVFAVEATVGGWAGGIPFAARFDGFLSVLVDEGTGIELVWGAADVFEAPVEGLDTAIVVGGPTAVLVAADFAFEPMHKRSCKLLVYSC